MTTPPRDVTAINPLSTVEDLAYQLSDAGATFLLTTPDLLATALRESQEEIGLEPRHVEALRALVGVYGDAGQRQPQAEMCMLLAPLASDPDERRNP